MRRKQAQTPNPLSPSALSADSDAPKSPASTGAMDDLLQKLRAAKPEARDQRDRRRRARLKDKHQVRVASGQKIPELDVNMEDEAAAADADAADKEGKTTLPPNSSSSDAADADPSTAVTTGPAGSSETDIADRAAAMLEGLQSGAGLNKDGSLSVRRRRESADTERQRRRNRRQQTSSTRTDEGGLMSPGVIVEEDAGDGGSERGDGEGGGEPGTPVTVVHPPSPEGKGSDKGREMLTPPPEE